MGAMIDTNEKSFFFPDIGIKDSGATVNGTPAFLLNNDPFNGNLVKLGIDDANCSWLICPHLSDPDRVFNYYMSLDMIIIKNDLSDFLKSCSPVTDGLFQETIVNPMIDQQLQFYQRSRIYFRI
jgi:hypothetical protein